MHRKLFSIFLSLFFGATPAFSATVIDDLGQTIHLSKTPQKIVTLYGALTDILLELGLGSKIVACTKEDKNLEPLKNKPAIGTHIRPNIELIVSLKPDLVLQMGTRKHSLMPVHRLQKLSIPVAVFNVQNFNELFVTIDKIGKLCGVETNALHLISKLQNRLKKVADLRPKNFRPPTVFFEVRYPNLLTVGKRSIVTEIIAKAGGINPVRKDKKLVRISEEMLIVLNPDIYIVQRGPMNKDPLPLNNRPLFRNLKAVKKENILYVDEKKYSRPGPKAVQAVEELSRFIRKFVTKKSESAGGSD